MSIRTPHEGSVPLKTKNFRVKIKDKLLYKKYYFIYQYLNFIKRFIMKSNVPFKSLSFIRNIN